jgi:hypothetical protein
MMRNVCMEQIRERIDEVLAARRARLPVVQRELSRWESATALLGQLAEAVSELQDPEAVVENAEVVRHLDLDVAGLSFLATQSLATLSMVRARVSRHTVNIGVSGRARNGKSTLLQSLSGLGDNQVPTGRGQPVTAVRSRIYHTPDGGSAQLTLHTEWSFCELVLGPYFSLLGLGPAPALLRDFERVDLLALTRDWEQPRVERFRPYVARLREMRDSLGTYRKYLTGEKLFVPLSDLRSWVAYPEHSEEGGEDRRYLAVREAVIRCPFPNVEVSALGLIDLPGLGELVPDAQAHHLAGLENDVDFVVIVKRPTENTAMWSEEDQVGLDLIARASGAADTRDFTSIVVNLGGCAAEDVQALGQHIRRQLNEGEESLHYVVWHADAADPADVSKRVMEPTLTHLATALPRMDQAVLEAAFRVCAANRDALLDAVGSALTALRSVAQPTSMEEVIGRAENLQDEVVAGLRECLGQLRERVGEQYEDVEFLRRVDALREEVRQWVLDGFGEGPQAWADHAYRAMGRAGGSVKFTTDAMNGIRTEIFRRYGGVDDVLSQRRQEFWGDLIAALGPRLGRLMSGKSPQERLSSLAERLREAPDPCHHLAEAVEVLLDVRLDYRTRLLPMMCQSLDVLRPERVDPRTGQVTVTVAVPPTREGASQLYSRVADLARMAIYDAGRGLETEPHNLAGALLAYAEIFEDTFIRSTSSDQEFRRLVSAYRDELWPEERSGPVTATARVQRVVSRLRSLAETLREEGPTS